MSESRPYYLVVRVAERTLALPVMQIVETSRVPSLQPGSGEVRGLIGLAVLRGVPTAVLDLGLLLGLRGRMGDAGENASQSTPETRVVTVRIGERSAALLVEEVIGVREIAPSAISSIALPDGHTQRIGEFDDEFARLIDASGLIEEDAWKQIAEVTQ